MASPSSRARRAAQRRVARALRAPRYERQLPETTTRRAREAATEVERRRAPGPGNFPEPYERAWSREVSRRVEREMIERTGYSRGELIQAHLEIFLSLPGMTEEDRGDRLYYWGQYLDATASGGQTMQQWLRDTGYDPRDFDWQMWRETIGYSRRK